MSSNEKGMKHDRILEAAVKVFARKGFHNARIAEVAREADVASGTIYLYFKNKDDILISVFEESLEAMIAKLEADLAGVKTPEDQLRCFIKSHLRILTEHRELAEVLQVELRQSHKFMKEYEPAHWLEYINILARILKEGQKQGKFRRDISLGIFKRAVFGALDEISLHWVVTKKDERYLEHAASQLCRMTLEGVLADKGGRPVRKQPRASPVAE